MFCAFSLSSGNCISLPEASKSISFRSTFRTLRLYCVWWYNTLFFVS